MKKEEREKNGCRCETAASSGLLKVFLRGAGQVVFQNSAWSGLLFIVGLFWGAYASGMGYVAWGGMLGLAVATLTGYILNLMRRDGEQGLWGFNGMLLGCALPALLMPNVWVWLCVVLFAMFTTFVRAGFNNIMSRWKINSLTFPFVLCTWIVLASSHAMHAASPEYPMLPAIVAPGVSLHFTDLALYWLRGISQLFFVDSWIAGLFILAGLAVNNLWAAVWAAVGSAVALLAAFLFRMAGAEIVLGIYGFNAVFTAVALGAIFYKPGFRSALWALFGIVMTIFVQEAAGVVAAPFGLLPLTFPFCITAWLFLLPLVKVDDNEHPDHSNWFADNKRHLAKRRRCCHVEVQ